MLHSGSDAAASGQISRITLGDNHLSIIDLHECSNQPMLDKYGMGSLKWMQENRQEIDAALLTINQNPNRKASNVVIDDDQDEY
jgi:hypothetical protein